MDSLQMVLRGLARRNVRASHVRRDRGLSPVFQPSLVQVGPRVAVSAGFPGRDERAEGCAVVGRTPPGASPTFGYAGGSTFAGKTRLLVVSYRVARVANVGRL